MTSKNVLKALSTDLINYFGINRKETCFDLSGPNLPLCHYPTRYQRTLIDYQQDSSKAVKQYFSAIDLRKRLTCFRSDKIDEERYQEILKKLKDYIKNINRRLYNRRIFERDRKPPWNRFWWKSQGITFRAIYLMKQYGARKYRNSDNNIFKFHRCALRSQCDNSRYRPDIYPLHKQKRISGMPPVLRMCPHPYVSRGEAERIINHAARLLLVTENFEPLAYDFTASGVKIRNLNPNKKNFKKNIASEVSTYKINKLKSESKSKSEETLLRIDSKENESSGNRVAAFKIKKQSQNRESTNEEEMASKVFSSEDGRLSPNIMIKSSVENNQLEVKREFAEVVDVNLKAGCFSQCRNKCKKSSKSKIEPIKEMPTIREITPISVTPKSSSEISEETRDILSDVLPKDDKISTIGGWLKSQASANEDESLKDDTFNNQNNQISNNTYISDRSVEGKISQRFEIKVLTGDRIGASTNAKIWLYIIGAERNLKKSVELRKSVTHRKPFQRGNTDIFRLKSSRFLGNIKSIQIGHDSDLPGSDWYLESVSITDCNKRLNYHFPCCRWLSVRTDDKLCRINLQYNPEFHQPIFENKNNVTNTDASIQCNDVENENEIRFSTFSSSEKYQIGNKFDRKEKFHHSQISDMVVEFSDLSASDMTANSLMSIRRCNDDYNYNLLQCNKSPENNCCNTAEITVLEDSERRSPLTTADDIYLESSDHDQFESDNILGSCSPNPTSRYEVSKSSEGFYN